jgi:hypothetical protein
MSIFETETLVVHVEGEFVIVGDLHGHVPDLLRVFIEFALPPATKYVFLCDCADRGSFSIHMTLYLLAFRCRYPRSVCLLCGNHEFGDVNKIMKLFAEIRNERHRPDLYVAFNPVFAYLRLPIPLDDDVVYLYGDLRPQFVSFDQSKTLSPPIAVSTDPIVEVIVWLDPDARRLPAESEAQSRLEIRRAGARRPPFMPRVQDTRPPSFVRPGGRPLRVRQQGCDRFERVQVLRRFQQTARRRSLYGV